MYDHSVPVVFFYKNIFNVPQYTLNSKCFSSKTKVLFQFKKQIVMNTFVNTVDVSYQLLDKLHTETPQCRLPERRCHAGLVRHFKTASSRNVNSTIKGPVHPSHKKQITT